MDFDYFKSYLVKKKQQHLAIEFLKMIAGVIQDSKHVHILGKNYALDRRYRPEHSELYIRDGKWVEKLPPDRKGELRECSEETYRDYLISNPDLGRFLSDLVKEKHKEIREFTLQKEAEIANIDNLVLMTRMHPYVEGGGETSLHNSAALRQLNKGVTMAPIMPTHLSILSPNKKPMKIHLSGIAYENEFGPLGVQAAPTYSAADIDQYLADVSPEDRYYTFVHIMMGPLTVARFPLKSFQKETKKIPPEDGWAQVAHADFQNWDNNKFEVFLWEDLNCQLYVGCSVKE